MDLENLILTYEPDAAKIAELQSVPVCLLVGIMGAGKNTIKKQLLSNGAYFEFVSYTTRPPRSNNGVMEVDGKDYFFIDIAEAERMLLAGEFIEAKKVGSNIYGTGLATLAQAKQSGKIALNDIDIQGVAEYKNLLPQTIAVFILPPSFAEWQKRVRSRYVSDEAFQSIWPERREVAIAELETALSVPYYHFVINNDLTTAVEAIDKIAHFDDKFHRKDDEARLLARDILAEILTN